MSEYIFNKFQGNVNTEDVKYIADPHLRNIVNTAIALERPDRKSTRLNSSHYS